MADGYSTGSDNICTDLGFSYQHNVQLLDDGSLLFFDNNQVRQHRTFDFFQSTFGGVRNLFF